MEAVAKLRNTPYPARKMRLLADLVRGKDVDEALTVLKFHPKKMYSIHVEKLILSAIANWQNKHEDIKLDENSLYVKHISVDNARQLKRIRPAPQGRAHRILKRFSHINLIIDTKQEIEEKLNEMKLKEADVSEKSGVKETKTKKAKKQPVQKTEKTQTMTKDTKAIEKNIDNTAKENKEKTK